MSLIRPEAIRRTRDRRNAAVDGRNALSTWAVKRPTGEVTDPITGDVTTTFTDVWSGNAHFSSDTKAFTRSRVDTLLTIEGPSLCVAHDVVGFELGDRVECTASDDATLPGRVWTVTGKPGSSYGRDRHYSLEEVSVS